MEEKLNIDMDVEAMDIIHSDEGEFIIDKDVPFPEDTRSSAKYPFKHMEVGDSIFLILKEGDNAKRMKNRLSQANSDVWEKTNSRMALYPALPFRKRNLRSKDMEKRLNAEVYIKELEEEIVKLKQKIDDLEDQLSGATPAYVDQD